MTMKGRWTVLLAVLGIGCLPILHAAEIETTGTPGSASATTTISGRQLPAPQPKFGGEIKGQRPAVEDLVGAAHRAAERGAERSADHHR